MSGGCSDWAVSRGGPAGGEPQTRPPRVTVSPRYLQLSAGQPAQLECSAEGSPAPSVQWTGGRQGRMEPDVSRRQTGRHTPESQSLTRISLAQSPEFASPRLESLNLPKRLLVQRLSPKIMSAVSPAGLLARVGWLSCVAGSDCLAR